MDRNEQSNNSVNRKLECFTMQLSKQEILDRHQPVRGKRPKFIHFIRFNGVYCFWISIIIHVSWPLHFKKHWRISAILLCLPYIVGKLTILPAKTLHIINILFCSKNHVIKNITVVILLASQAAWKFPKILHSWNLLLNNNMDFLLTLSCDSLWQI